MDRHTEQEHDEVDLEQDKNGDENGAVDDDRQRLIVAETDEDESEPYHQRLAKAVFRPRRRKERSVRLLIGLAVSILGVNGLYLIVRRHRQHPSSHHQIALESLISEDHRNVTADVKYLMDFAIIGHSKTGTTFLKQWLRHHPQILMYNHEIYHMRDAEQGPAKMVQAMFELGPFNEHYRRGYKAPNDIRRPAALKAFQKYWPNTKMVVGLRHPVKWFESFYNYNVKQFQTIQTSHPLIPAEQMVGKKLPGHVQYHRNLAMLGKTNVTDPKERALLGDVEQGLMGSKKKVKMPYPPIRMANPVFLYEVSQPFVKEDGAADQFAVDFQDFLELDKPFKPADDFYTFREKFLVAIGRKKKYDSSNLHYAIDICEDKYRRLRNELLELGGQAAEWITDYFMLQPEVRVSSPDHFRELIKTWSVDPCEK